MNTLTPTWYDLLGVEPSASAEEIRTAWRTAIAELDPTERRFATLNEAAAVLLDPARRSAYDEELRAAEPEPELAPEPELEAAFEPEPADASEQPTEEKPRTAPYLLSGWVLATVGVVALALVVLAGVLAAHAPADKVVQSQAQLSSGSKVTDVEQRTLAAQAAAKEAVVPILSYDYRKLDAGQRAADDLLTDSYRATYDKLFDKLKASITSTQTVITAKVVDSAVVRASGDRVQVLLFVDRPTTNKASTTPIPYQDQVTLTMQQVGGKWLVDDMVTTQIPD